MSCSLYSENGGHFKPKYGGHFDRFFQDIYDIYYLVGTNYNYPFPVIAYQHFESQKKYSVGGTIGLYYSRKIGSRLLLIPKVAFQTDTNGDNFGFASLGIGYVL